jgi:hypothetical protein
MTEHRAEVARDVVAPTQKIFALLCDPRGHVAIDASGMLQSAEGDSVRAVGDTFVVHMDREALNDRPIGKYDATVEITAFEQDRRIEWTPSIEHGYCFGYLLEPIDVGCRVISYCDWSERAAQGRRHEGFPLISVATLRASLGILARTVEEIPAIRA